MTPTSTNLLGIVKHVASVEGRLPGRLLRPALRRAAPWFDDDAEPNADMWATPDESQEMIVGLFTGSGPTPDATIDALDLDAVGFVDWWPRGST